MCNDPNCVYKVMWEKLLANLTTWQEFPGLENPSLGVTAARGRMLWLQDLWLPPSTALSEEADRISEEAQRYGQ